MALADDLRELLLRTLSALDESHDYYTYTEFLKSLPPGPLLFKTPEEANRYIQEERDSWER